MLAGSRPRHCSMDFAVLRRRISGAVNLIAQVSLLAADFRTRYPKSR